jgi:hypothetical protein
VSVNVATLVVVCVDMLRYLHSAAIVLLQQQVNRQPSAFDTPGSIEARTYLEDYRS